MPCFSGGIFSKVQAFQGLGTGFRSSPKVYHRFKLFTFTSYLWLQFFFFFKYQRKKIYPPNLIVALKFSLTLWFLAVFLIHDKLVRQKISYGEIIYLSRKRCSFFYIRMRMFVNFFKHLIDIFSKLHLCQC